MRRELSAELEKCRIDGEPGAGPYGRFVCWCPVTRARLVVIASDGRDWQECGMPGEPWEHVSVSARDRCPTWEEMIWVKRLFWPEDEWAVQYGPAEGDYVNVHRFVLHWWRPASGAFPVPPKACV